MNIWSAAVAIVAIVFIFGGRIIKYQHMHRSSGSEEDLNDISHRMSRLEDRMANIETIVLDKEKEKKFEEL